METRNKIDEATSFSIAFRMIGNSMSSGLKWSFSDGDYLRCNEVNVQDIQIGHEYVIKAGNSYLVRQITSVEDGVITCAPLNPLYKNSQLCIDDIQQVFIIKSYQRASEQEGGIE